MDSMRNNPVLPLYFVFGKKTSNFFDFTICFKYTMLNCSLTCLLEQSFCTETNLFEVPFRPTLAEILNTVNFTRKLQAFESSYYYFFTLAKLRVVYETSSRKQINANANLHCSHNYYYILLSLLHTINI